MKQALMQEPVVMAYVLVEIVAGGIRMQQFLVNLFRNVEVVIGPAVTEEPDAQRPARRNVSDLVDGGGVEDCGGS
jgi:hypothetical protein